VPEIEVLLLMLATVAIPPHTLLAMVALPIVGLLAPYLTNTCQHTVAGMHRGRVTIDGRAIQMTDLGMAAVDRKTLVTRERVIETTAQIVAVVTGTETGLEIHEALHAIDEITGHVLVVQIDGTETGTETGTSIGGSLSFGRLFTFTRHITSDKCGVLLSRIGAERFHASGTGLDRPGGIPSCAL
jgi:hypothetical protein